MTNSTGPADLVVVGAGIVGLAHAVEASARGMSVTIIERDERPVGASVRNFGHGCFTAQEGAAYAYGARARGTWLRLAREAGFGARECGTVVVARADEELACLEELATVRGRDEVELLTAAQVRDRVPVAAGGLRGGAFLPRDIRVAQRDAAPAVAAWLARQPGVRIHWGRAVTGLDEGVVHTTRGDVTAGRVVVCVGHDLDRLAPDITEHAGVRRCVLQMLQVRPVRPVRLDPAVLTGTSMLRYPAFAATLGAQALRTRLLAERPDLVDAVVNHMLTQLPGGDLVVGDTHAYAHTPAPWSDEDLDELLLSETRALLDVGELRVVRRWRGVYASAPEPFLRADLAPGVTAVSVTSGIGMTTAFGLAPAVLDTVTGVEQQRSSRPDPRSHDMRSKPVLELVALDIAGTTVEEGGAVYRVLSEVVRAAGAPDDVDVRPWMGADKRDAIAGLLGLDVRDPVVDTSYADFRALLAQAYAGTPPHPFDGVVEAFAQLRAAGVKVALTTGFDRSITDPLLAAIGWRVGEQLDAVVCAEEVQAGRPGPYMIRRAMELTGVTDPAAVLVAGDTVLDVQAGLAAGAGSVVAVLTGAQTEAELTAAGPTAVLAGVREIPATVLASHG